MSTDFSKGRLPQKMTPELIFWLRDHAIVSQVIETPHGKAAICENYVLDATPEELEARRRHIQDVAAQLAARQRT